MVGITGSCDSASFCAFMIRQRSRWDSPAGGSEGAGFGAGGVFSVLRRPRKVWGLGGGSEGGRLGRVGDGSVSAGGFGVRLCMGYIRASSGLGFNVGIPSVLVSSFGSGWDFVGWRARRRPRYVLSGGGGIWGGGSRGVFCVVEVTGGGFCSGWGFSAWGARRRPRYVLSGDGGGDWGGGSLVKVASCRFGSGRGFSACATRRRPRYVFSGGGGETRGASSGETSVGVEVRAGSFGSG